MDLSLKTLDELKQIAKANNLTGYSGLRKPALIRLLSDSKPEKSTACESMKSSDVLHLAKQVGVSTRKSIAQLCKEIGAAQRTISEKESSRRKIPSAKKVTIKSLEENLSDLLYETTPLSSAAIKEILKCAKTVISINRRKCCNFSVKITSHQFYQSLIRILDSGMIADLYADYISDPNAGPIPINLEKILLGEAILSVFVLIADELACPDPDDYNLIVTPELVHLLKVREEY
jgi:hypothetical protein